MVQNYTTLDKSFGTKIQSQEPKIWNYFKNMNAQKPYILLFKAIIVLIQQN